MPRNHTVRSRESSQNGAPPYAWVMWTALPPVRRELKPESRPGESGPLPPPIEHHGSGRRAIEIGGIAHAGVGAVPAVVDDDLPSGGCRSDSKDSVLGCERRRKQ
jgi:hypothetical protein